MKNTNKTNQMKKLFIIISIIYFSKNKISYSDTRSAFSPLERAKQTKKTIETIRDKMPNTDILLVELGHNRKIPLNLEKSVDKYLYIGDSKLVRMTADSKYKGLGEAIAIIKALKEVDKSKYKGFFKIPGRYYLTNNFKSSLFDAEKMVFCRKKIYISRKMYFYSVSTRLYYIPIKYFNIFRNSLYLSIPLLLLNVSIENSIPWFIRNKNITNTEVLGVAGMAGTYKSIINE